ncbi:MAG: H-type lectin domain-containing protein, partial [Magnetococcales bacterium]|nr:H-type lectin domain-containing protein [Magnetococcales bacterium]
MIRLLVILLFIAVLSLVALALSPDDGRPGPGSRHAMLTDLKQMFHIGDPAAPGTAPPSPEPPSPAPVAALSFAPAVQMHSKPVAPPPDPTRHLKPLLSRLDALEQQLTEVSRQRDTLQQSLHQLSERDMQRQHTLDTLTATVQVQQQQLTTLAETEGVLIETGSVISRRQDAGWKLEDILNRTRVFRKTIAFNRTFPVPPKLFLSLTQLDLTSANTQMQVAATKVDHKGFELVLTTRSEERIRQVQVEWLAHGVTVAAAVDAAAPESQ